MRLFIRSYLQTHVEWELDIAYSTAKFSSFPKKKKMNCTVFPHRPLKKHEDEDNIVGAEKKTEIKGPTHGCSCALRPIDFSWGSMDFGV